MDKDLPFLAEDLKAVQTSMRKWLPGILTSLGAIVVLFAPSCARMLVFSQFIRPRFGDALYGEHSSYVMREAQRVLSTDYILPITFYTVLMFLVGAAMLLAGIYWFVLNSRRRTTKSE